MKPLLDVREVARLLNCSTGSVYRAALLKKIPSLKTPGGRRFDPDDLEAWLREQKTNTGGRA